MEKINKPTLIENNSENSNFEYMIKQIISVFITRGIAFSFKEDKEHGIMLTIEETLSTALSALEEASDYQDFSPNEVKKMVTFFKTETNMYIDDSYTTEEPFDYDGSGVGYYSKNIGKIKYIIVKERCLDNTIRYTELQFDMSQLKYNCDFIITMLKTEAFHSCEGLIIKWVLGNIDFPFSACELYNHAEKFAIHNQTK